MNEDKIKEALLYLAQEIDNQRMLINDKYPHYVEDQVERILEPKN